MSTLVLFFSIEPHIDVDQLRPLAELRALGDRVPFHSRTFGSGLAA
jgi:hypothetical protein